MGESPINLPRINTAIVNLQQHAFVSIPKWQYLFRILVTKQIVWLHCKYKRDKFCECSGEQKIIRSSDGQSVPFLLTIIIGYYQNAPTDETSVE